MVYASAAISGLTAVLGIIGFMRGDTWEITAAGAGSVFVLYHLAIYTYYIKAVGLQMGWNIVFIALGGFLFIASLNANAGEGMKFWFKIIGLFLLILPSVYVIAGTAGVVWLVAEGNDRRILIGLIVSAVALTIILSFLIYGFFGGWLKNREERRDTKKQAQQDEKDVDAAVEENRIKDLEEKTKLADKNFQEVRERKNLLEKLGSAEYIEKKLDGIKYWATETDYTFDYGGGSVIDRFKKHFEDLLPYMKDEEIHTIVRELKQFYPVHGNAVEGTKWTQEQFEKYLEKERAKFSEIKEQIEN